MSNEIIYSDMHSFSYSISTRKRNIHSITIFFAFPSWMRHHKAETPANNCCECRFEKKNVNKKIHCTKHRFLINFLCYWFFFFFLNFTLQKFLFCFFCATLKMHHVFSSRRILMVKTISRDLVRHSLCSVAYQRLCDAITSLLAYIIIVETWWWFHD
jgi:hypothetical protein